LADGREGYRVVTVVGGLELGRGGVAGVAGDLAVEAAVVEPVDVGEGRELDVVEPPPRSATVDELPLVEPVEALGEGIVVAVALRSDRRRDLRLHRQGTVNWFRAGDNEDHIGGLGSTALQFGKQFGHA